MPHASDVNAWSSSFEDSDADSADKIEGSGDDGGQRPSPSLFRLQQAAQNADVNEDDDGEDNHFNNGFIPDTVSEFDADEDYQQSESTLPPRYRKNPCSRLFRIDSPVRNLNWAEPKADSYVP